MQLLRFRKAETTQPRPRCAGAPGAGLCAQARAGMQSISDEERAAEVKQIEHRLRTLRETPDEAVKALVKLSHEPGMWMLVRL